MTATTTFFAYRIQNGQRHFFEFERCDTWNSREELMAAIEKWKKTVPENYAARVTFEIHQDN